MVGVIERKPCTGGTPPWCCQPPMTEAERERQDWRIRRIREAFMAETPKTCPWLGHSYVMPVFVTTRRSWLCLDCRRETSVGGDG